MSNNGKHLPVIGGAPAPSADPLERLLAGDSAGVIGDLKDQLEADPDDEVAWLQLATAYAHIAHWPDAATAAGRAVALDGDVVEARRAFARALSKLRRFDETAFQLVQAKRLAPDDARVAHELGVAFYDKRLFDKALRELSRARELAPDDARVCFALGLAHEAKGDMAAAISAYRETVRLDEQLIDARRTLADALAAMGEMAAAVSELAEAQARDRTNPQIALNLDVLKKGLADLEATQLMGKQRDQVDTSALVLLGKLQLAESPTTPMVLRYVAELVELWVHLDEHQRVAALMLVFPDPPRAAAHRDDTFEVTVVSTDGSHVPTNFATAATLTFLRDALGCPLTRASELYALLLNRQEPVRWGGSLLSFAEVSRDGVQHHGLRVHVG